MKPLEIIQATVYVIALAVLVWVIRQPDPVKVVKEEPIKCGSCRYAKKIPKGGNALSQFKSD